MMDMTHIFGGYWCSPHECKAADIKYMKDMTNLYKGHDSYIWGPLAYAHFVSHWYLFAAIKTAHTR